MRIRLMIAALGLLWSGSALAQCPTLPNQISNGQPADASKVMQDLDHLRDCINGAVGTPSVPSLSVRSPSGPAATIRAPSVPVPYDLNLPTGPGSPGQTLVSAGPGLPTYWSSIAGAKAPIPDGYPVLRPVATSLTWYNQGTSTLTDNPSGPVTLRMPSSGAYQLHAVGVAAPSGPFTVTAKINCSWPSGSSFCGVYVADSAGKVILMGMGGSNMGYFRASSFTNQPSGAQTFNMYEKPVWFRIRSDATKWYYSWSTNGADWSDYYSENLNSYLGTSIVSAGVAGMPASSTGLESLLPIWSLEVKSGAGTNSSWQ